MKDIADDGDREIFETTAIFQYGKKIKQRLARVFV